MAHVLCIYICSLSRNEKSSRVFQNNSPSIRGVEDQINTLGCYHSVGWMPDAVLACF